ncbi:MAG: thioredoxin family protein [Anaerolineales bacterium]|nr:MAG: thioredoxin family protein [Anaerolineales bacterium]
MPPTPISMTEDRFLSGFTWPDFVAHMRVNQKRVSQLFDEIILTQDDRQGFAEAITGHDGQVHIVALVEDWCGDVAVILPLVARLATEVAGISLRLFVRSDNPDLARAYAEVGITSIPVLSFFNSDWHEVGRWVERSAAAHRQVADWNAAHPQIETLRRSDQPQDRSAYRALMKERLIEMMGWYRDGLWQATLAELKSELSG